MSIGVKYADPSVVLNASGTEFTLPGNASLVWYPWPEGLAEPIRNPGYYRPITIHGKSMEMPRRTRCYGYAYNFSGQTHPLEPETPTNITNLYDACEKLFGYPKGTLNMCLENDYANGRECIGAHSDDERQFGSMHDVVCAVTGPAKRLMVIREKKKIMLEVWMPAGIYAMRGRMFQKRYTHEFPQHNPAIFKRLCALAAKAYEVTEAQKRARLEWPKDASQLEQARWIQENAQDVKELLDNTKDKEKFEEWLQHRTSYTMRNFAK
jgi:alkylated DNA repair dioxygenase AlkB